MNKKLFKKLHICFRRSIALALCVTVASTMFCDSGTAYAADAEKVKGYAWTRAWGDDDMKALVEQAENNEINRTASEKDVRVLIVYDDKYFVSGNENQLNDDGEFHGSILPSAVKLDQPYFTTRKSYSAPYIKLDESEPYNKEMKCWSFDINLVSSADTGKEQRGKMWLYHENLNFPCIFTYFFTFRNSLNEGKDDDEGSVTMKSYRERDIQFDFNSFYECFDMRKTMEERMISDYNTDDITALTNGELKELQIKAMNDCQTRYYMSYWMYEEDKEDYEKLAKFLRDRRNADEYVAWSPNSFCGTDLAWIIVGAVTVLSFGTIPGYLLAGALGITAGITENVKTKCCGLAAGATGLGKSSSHDYNTGENYLPLLMDSSNNTSFFPSMDLLEDESLIYFSDEYKGLKEEEKALAEKAYQSDLSKHKTEFDNVWKKAVATYMNDFDDTDHNEVPFGCTKLHYSLSGRGDASWRWDGSKIYASCYESGWNAAFKVYIGEPIYLPTVTGSFKVYANQTKILDNINIGKGVVLKVDKGGTLIIRGKVYNEGIINCEGTVIVESGAALVDEFVWNAGGAKESGRKYAGKKKSSITLQDFLDSRNALVDKAVEDALTAALNKSRRGKAQLPTLSEAEKERIIREVTNQVAFEENENFVSRYTGSNSGNTDEGYFTNVQYEEAYQEFLDDPSDDNFYDIIDNSFALPDGSTVVKNGGLLYVQEGALLMMSKDPILKAYSGGNIIIDGLAACLANVVIDDNSNLEIGPTGEMCIGGTIDLEDSRISTGDIDPYVQLKSLLRTNSLYVFLKGYDGSIFDGMGLEKLSSSSKRKKMAESLGLKVTNHSTVSAYGILEMLDNEADAGGYNWSDEAAANYCDSTSAIIGLDKAWNVATTRCVNIARYRFSME